jgi:hypothetical protein
LFSAAELVHYADEAVRVFLAAYGIRAEAVQRRGHGQQLLVHAITA